MLTQDMKRVTMNVGEMAEQLGISKPVAYELANRADFPCLRIGKRIVIPREAFDRWLMDSVAHGQAIIPINVNAGRR